MNARQRLFQPVATSGILAWILLALGLATTIAVYYPGLFGPFIFDDIFNIVTNQRLWLTSLDASELRSAAFSTDTGPFKRPLSMASFALNLYFFGESAFSFKVVNLGIHLLNGILIFLLARGLLRLATQRSDLGLPGERADWAAALIAALWLAHPINLTSVLYVVQRMASLSTLFVLLALLAYLKGRLLLPDRRGLGIALLGASVLFWCCGLASKENALLLPWYIFLIEWLFLEPLRVPLSWAGLPPLKKGGGGDFDGPQRSMTFKSPLPPFAKGGDCISGNGRGEGTGRLAQIYTWAWLIVPLIGGAIYWAFHPGMLNHDFRSFTLVERVLTETRALWFYLGLMVLPRHEALGIYHDDFPLSVGLLTPWTTLPAIVGLLLMVGFAVRVRRTQPLLAFGILFFFAAHALESSVFPLEIMHEHRNYLASFGILFGGGAALLMRDSRHLQLKARIVLVGIFFIFLSAITLGQALDWRNFSFLMLRQVAMHPESSYAHNDTGRLYLYLRDEAEDPLKKREYTAKAVEHFLKTAELLPQHASGLVTALYAKASFAKAADEAIVQEALKRLRHGTPSDLTLRALLVLSACERNKQCTVPAGQVEALFQAVLANPGLGGEERAEMFDEAVSRAVSAQRFDEAEALFQQGLAHSDDVRYRLSYAKLLIHLQRLDEARELIRQALASPQPARIVKMADDLKRRIEAGPDLVSPDVIKPVD